MLEAAQVTHVHHGQAVQLEEVGETESAKGTKKDEENSRLREKEPSWGKEGY